MSITLSGTDRTIHTRMAAQSPAVDIASGTWRLGDTLPNGDPVALTSVGVGAGFTGNLDMTLVRAADSVGDSTVRLYYRCVDAAGAVTDSDQTGTISVTSTENTVSLPIGPAGPGTVECEIGLLSAMNPPGDPVRVNRFPDPRATNVANFYTRYSWGLAAYTTGTTPVTGLTTYVRVNCTSSDTGSGRGINLYDSTDRSNPLGAAGYPVTDMVGQTITVSCYVYSTKAGTYALSARGYAGTTWKGSAASGSSVSVAANTWTRLSVTYTVASGATDMCVTAMTTNSVAWVNGDYIGMSLILFEDGATLSPYFDGTSAQLVAGTKSSRWEGATNNSNSLLWAAAIPGGTTVQATDSVLTYSAECEELVGVALERDLRRSVADIWSDAQALITAGTAGLLGGQLTFLCRSLAEALGLDAVYRMPGLVVLSSGDELDGLTHRAVGRARINPERLLPGKSPRWLLVVDFREQVT